VKSLAVRAGRFRQNGAVSRAGRVPRVKGNVKPDLGQGFAYLM